MKRKALAAAGAAIIAMQPISAYAAEEYYTLSPDASYVIFSSVDKLKSYISSRKGTTDPKLDFNISTAINGATYLYCPMGYTEPDRIIISPYLIRTEFDKNSLSFSYYSNTAMGSSELQTAIMMSERDGYNSAVINVYDNQVYCYDYFENNSVFSCYVWEQNGLVFKLTSPGYLQNNNFSLCRAYAISLLDIPNAPDLTGNLNIYSPKNQYSKGLRSNNGKLYYIKEDGSFAIGWQNINDSIYYFNDDGTAVTSSAIIDGTRYKFASDGTLTGTYTGWTKINGKYYYYKEGQKLKNVWINVKGKRTYYIRSDGSRAQNVKLRIGGKLYSFGADGKVRS